jgi:hypothetical protein
VFIDFRSVGFKRFDRMIIEDTSRCAGAERWRAARADEKFGAHRPICVTVRDLRRALRADAPGGAARTLGMEASDAFAPLEGSAAALRFAAAWGELGGRSSVNGD